MTYIDKRLETFLWIIEGFNSKGRYLIKNEHMKKELIKNSIFVDYPNINQYIVNTFLYLEKQGKVLKTHERGVHFGLIKHTYPLSTSTITNIDDLYNKINISDDVYQVIEELNSISDMKFNEEIFKKESIFTTIVEYGTITEDNYEDRSKNLEDYEVIEVQNLLGLYHESMINEPVELSDFVLRGIHSRIFRYLKGSERINKEASIGEYTYIQNYISGGYLPCPIDDKLKELAKFIEFYNEKPKDLKDALIRLAYIHYWFAGIHIFSDGNSRTGRFLLSYYMQLHGYTNVANFSISKSLFALGGKATFVEQQGRSWDNKDIESYVKWFIEELLNISWVKQMKELLG